MAVEEANLEKNKAANATSTRLLTYTPLLSVSAEVLTY
jgi:hypothetical protein